VTAEWEAASLDECAAVSGYLHGLGLDVDVHLDDDEGSVECAAVAVMVVMMAKYQSSHWHLIHKDGG
jgi:hypothetical protein